MNDDFWKKAGEAIDAQVKELAEKRAINTAKQLNEIHEATRKEMNEKEVVNQLKAANINYNTAVGKIVRLEAEVKEVAHANDDLIKRNIELGSSNNRLVVELNNLAPASHSDKDVAIRDDELRDQFACAALQGILSGLGWLPGSSAQAADAVAEQSYVYADSMLKAKEKKNA